MDYLPTDPREGDHRSPPTPRTTVMVSDHARDIWHIIDILPPIAGPRFWIAPWPAEVGEGRVSYESFLALYGVQGLGLIIHLSYRRCLRYTFVKNYIRECFWIPDTPTPLLKQLPQSGSSTLEPTFDHPLWKEIEAMLEDMIRIGFIVQEGDYIFVGSTIDFSGQGRWSDTDHLKAFDQALKGQY